MARTREQASRALVAVDDEADDAPPPLAPVPRPPPGNAGGEGLDRPRRGAVRPPLAGAARGPRRAVGGGVPVLRARRPAAALGAGRGARRRRGAAPRGAREGARRRRRRRHPLGLAALRARRARGRAGDALRRAAARAARVRRVVVLRTEAGARRRTEHGDAPGFGAAKNPFADHDAAEWEWDEWDLTLPNHAAATKRGAIRAFYDAYYAACAELEREFPANVRTYDCEALFESEAEQRDLFAWLGIRGDPPRERVCENQQRYLYLAPEGDDDAFVAGDFAERRRRRRRERDGVERRRRRARTVAAPRRASPDARRMLAVVVPMGARPGDKVNFTFRGVAIQATVPAGLAPGDKFHVPAPDRPDDPRPPPVPPPARRRRRLQSRRTPRTRSGRCSRQQLFFCPPFPPRGVLEPSGSTGSRARGPGP